MMRRWARRRGPSVSTFAASEHARELVAVAHVRNAAVESVVQRVDGPLGDAGAGMRFGAFVHRWARVA
jgi:hypothetical protein